MMISWDFGMGFIGLPSGYDVYSLPWLNDGPNRNRWAIPFLIAWVDLSMAMLNHQRVF